MTNLSVIEQETQFLFHKQIKKAFCKKRQQPYYLKIDIERKYIDIEKKLFLKNHSPWNN